MSDCKYIEQKITEAYAAANKADLEHNVYAAANSLKALIVVSEQLLKMVKQLRSFND